MAERKAPKKEPPKTPKKTTKKPSGKSKPKPKSKSVEVVGLPAVKRERGRPSDYKSEYAEQAFKYALLGADDHRMAELFGVALSTFHLWKIKYSDFSDSLKAGKDDADANIANSLYFKAKGYQEIRVTKLINNDGVEMGTKEETINHGPDTMSMIYWLNNRQRKQWKAKNEELENAKYEMEMAKMKFDQEIQLAKLEIERQKLELSKIKASMGTEEETESDGFLEALNDSAQDAFEDFEDVE